MHVSPCFIATNKKKKAWNNILRIVIHTDSFGSMQNIVPRTASAAALTNLMYCTGTCEMAYVNVLLHTAYYTKSLTYSMLLNCTVWPNANTEQAISLSPTKEKANSGVFPQFCFMGISQLFLKMNLFISSLQTVDYLHVQLWSEDEESEEM